MKLVSFLTFLFLIPPSYSVPLDSFWAVSKKYTPLDSLILYSNITASGAVANTHSKLKCADVTSASEKCVFAKKHCKDEHLGFLNYLEIYYCSKSQPIAIAFIAFIILWLCTLFMAIGIAASDYLCPNLNTISKMLGLSESLAGVTFLAFGNGSPDVFSTYAAMKIGSGSLAIGELIGAASFITAVVVGSMGIIRPFKVSRRSFIRDIVFFMLAVSSSMYFIFDGILERWECFAMLAIYIVYVIVVVSWHWYKTTKRKQYLVETRARDFYTEVGHESRIEEDEEIDDHNSILASGLDISAFNATLGDDRLVSEGLLDPHNFRFHSKATTPRGSICDFPLSPTPAWQEQSEEEQEEVYGELTRGMRLRPQNSTQIVSSSSSMVMPSASTGAYGSHSPITPIRPSLVGALEFRDVLHQLQDSNAHVRAILLTPRSQEIARNDEELGLSQSLPSNPGSYLQSWLQLKDAQGDNSSQYRDTPVFLTPSPHALIPNYDSRNNKSWSSLPISKSPQDPQPFLNNSNGKPSHKLLPRLQIPQIVVTEPSDLHSDTISETPSPLHGHFDNSDDNPKDYFNHTNHYNGSKTSLNSNSAASPTSIRSKSPASHHCLLSASGRSTPTSVTSPILRLPISRLSSSSSFNDPRNESFPSTNINSENTSPVVPFIHNEITDFRESSNQEISSIQPQISSISEAAIFENKTHGSSMNNNSQLTHWLFNYIPSVPQKYIPLFETLFPSLIGITHKGWINVIISFTTAPAILLLNTTVPVIDIETMKNPDTESVKFTRCNSTAGFEDVEVEGETQIQVYDGNPKTTDTNDVENPSDEGPNLTSKPSLELPTVTETQTLTSVTNESFCPLPLGLEIQNSQNSNTFHPITHSQLEPYIPIKRWLLVTQAIFGPLFVFTSKMDIRNDDYSYDKSDLCITVAYSFAVSLALLSLLKVFIKHTNYAPTYIQFVSLIGFVIAINWVSVVANEVVAVLKALGIIFQISDAILGLTVFAVGNSLGDLVANTTVAKMGYPMMALSACFGGPMLNILVGIGMSGLLAMAPNTGLNHKKGILLPTEPNTKLSFLPAVTQESRLSGNREYPIQISHTLIISFVTLLTTLLFLLVIIPLNKWRMSRTIGFITVSFWIISTVVTVFFEVLV